MKKAFILLTFLTLLTVSLFAQVPQKLSWQGIVRDNAGNPITATVELRFTILQGATGVFTEIKALTPNAFGLVVWNIGEQQTADFAAIDWTNGVKTLQVEMRTTVGSGNFTTVGTEELKSVPYALIAGKALIDQDNQTLTLNGSALSISGGNNVVFPHDGDTSSTNEIQALSLTGSTLSLSKGGGSVTLPAQTPQTLALNGQNLSISGGNTVVLQADGDTSSTNELQNLSLTGTTLTLSKGGGSVTLPPETPQTLTLNGLNLSISGGNTVALQADGDTSSTNELQNISLTGSTLTLSKGGGSVTLPAETPQTLTLNDHNLSISNGNTVVLQPDGDTSSTNELQYLTLSNDTIRLSKGGGFVLLQDTSSTNELQAISLSGSTLSLSKGGGSVDLPPESQTLALTSRNLSISGGNTVVLPTDGDTSSTNEIQHLSMSKDTLVLSQNGGFVILKDTSSTNELQTIALTGTTLTLSKGGGSVNLPSGSSYVAGPGISINGNTISAQDPSPLNEIQVLSISGNQVSLSSGGGTITLPTVTIPPSYWAASGANIYNTNGGNVGIGTPSPSARLDVAGDLNLNKGTSGIALTTNGTEAIWYDGYYSWGFGGGSNFFNSVTEIGTNVCCWELEVNGEVAKPGGGSWSALSDLRYKENVQPFTDGLQSILKINPVRYHYNSKSGYDTNPEYVGVIAQELQKTAPYMVRELPVGKLNGKTPAAAANDLAAKKTTEQTNDTYLSVDNSAMTYMLINAIKDQQTQINQLKADLQQLRRQVAELTGKN